MTLLDSIRQHHQRLLRLLAFLTLAGTESEKRSLASELKREFESQERLERERLLEPSTRAAAADAAAPERDPRLLSLLEETSDRLSDIRDLFREIELTPSGKELDAPLGELLRAVRNHIEEEEIRLFPRLDRLKAKTRRIA